MTGYDKDLKRRTKDAVPYRWLLSGTPMLNRPIELVSQLTIIDRLQELGGFKNFVATYCDAKHNGFAWDYSGAKNMAGLGVAMKRIMLRRTKAEVLPELPPKSREYLSVALANEAEYRRAEGAVAKWIGECRAKDAEFMEGLYAQAAEAGLEGEGYEAFMAKAIEARERSATKRAERAEALVRFTALKRLAAKGKLPAVIEWVQDWLDSNEGRKLVIFGHHVETVRELAAAFGSRAIEGSTSAQDRQAYVDEFQTDPSVRVIVANIQAGGVGITLTAASDVLFVEQHWNPGTHDQAEDRVNRLGQSRACVAYYMIAEGTIDEEIASMIEGKRAIVAEGTGDEGALKTLGTWLSARGGKA
jgi:SWI/SNF-related matrix-associated actin-dependent regulator 1 of chromatin subfamily A